MAFALTKTELERLLELATLGDWLVNGHRPDEERLESHEGVLQKLYALSEEEGLGYLVDVDEETGRLKASDALVARLGLAGYVAEYDECVFWDELAIRLAERDLRAEIGIVAFDALPPLERQERVDAIAETYDREFDRRGIEHFRLDHALDRRTRDALTERLLKLFNDSDAS